MKKRFVCLVLFAVVLSSLWGCRAPAQSAEPLPKVHPRKLIIDTDTGADDAAAIIMAALQPEIEILGVTVIAGNVSLEQAALNALMSLQIAGRTQVPVYCGSREALSGREFGIFSVFGEDGMGDAGLIHPVRSPETDPAVDFILDTVRGFPNEVELIALGPSTNIARAIRQDPDTMKKAKHIWVMGTAGFTPDAPAPEAEFNILLDPEAFAVLVESGLPVTVIGMDTNTDDTWLNREEQRNLMAGNDIQRFLGAAISGYMAYNQTAAGRDAANLPDPIAMACLLWEGYLQETVTCQARVVTAPGDAFGQVMFCEEGEAGSVRVAVKTHSELFKTWFLQTLEKGLP